MTNTEHLDRLQRIICWPIRLPERAEALESLTALRADTEALESNYKAQDAALTSIYTACGGKLEPGDTAANFDPQVVVRLVAALRTSIAEMEREKGRFWDTMRAIAVDGLGLTDPFESESSDVPEDWKRLETFSLAIATIRADKNQWYAEAAKQATRAAALTVERDQARAELEAAEEIGSGVLSLASDIGSYYGEHHDSALDCIRGELAAYNKVMWAITGTLNSGSARPDDVEAAVLWAAQRIASLEEALRNLLDTAKSYRSDILGLHCESLPSQRFFELRHAPKRVDRDRVIDEADSALSSTTKEPTPGSPAIPAPSGETEASRESAARPFWLIYYEDADVQPELFTDESAAREHFARRLERWNCHLFRRVVALPTPPGGPPLATI